MIGDPHGGQINEQTRPVQTNKNSKINLQLSNEVKQQIGYFTESPDKDAHMVSNAELTQELHNK